MIFIKNYLEVYDNWWDDPALNNTSDIIDFPAHNNNNNVLFKRKEKITDQTDNDGAKVKIMVLLKDLNNIWRTLEMSLINWEINIILTWYGNCFISTGIVANQVPIFAIADTKLYVLVVTLSSQDNAKLLQQLKLSFKRTINWNKYQSKVTIQRRNQYLNYLIYLRFRE